MCLVHSVQLYTLHLAEPFTHGKTSMWLQSIISWKFRVGLIKGFPKYKGEKLWEEKHNSETAERRTPNWWNLDMIINVTLLFPQNIWYEDILGYIYSKSHNYFMMVSCALLVPTALKIQQRQSQNCHKTSLWWSLSPSPHPSILWYPDF